MPKTTTCPIPQSYNCNGAVISNSTGNCGVTAGQSPSNVILAYQAGANDSNLKALLVSSDDSSPRVVNVYRYDGTNYWLLGCVNVPVTAGTITSTPAVDLLANLPGLPLDPSGKPCIPLKGGNPDKIYVGSQTTLTSGKFLVFTAIGEDF